MSLNGESHGASVSVKICVSGTISTSVPLATVAVGDYNLNAQVVDSKGASASEIFSLPIGAREYTLEVSCTVDSMWCPDGAISMPVPPTFAHTIGGSLSSYDHFGNQAYVDACVDKATQIDGLVKATWDGIPNLDKLWLNVYNADSEIEVARIEHLFAGTPTPCQRDPGFKFGLRVKNHN